MPNDYCFGFPCFAPLDMSTPKFFGFAEFLAGLALMVLAWTIADVRYRFRVRTTPIPLQGVTFVVVAVVGVLALLTDLWRAEQWWVPQVKYLTASVWQAILGGLFLLSFLTWAWFAFIRPPRYGKSNAKRYERTLYRYIVKGSATDLAVIADEFALSAKSLINFATDRDSFRSHPKNNGEKETPQKKMPKVTAIANDILLLIADKRFCRAIVDSSPGTILAVFSEIGETKKYGIQIDIFANNIVNAAIANKDSFLFHEAEGYKSGLIGYHKPISQAMFSNYKMVERIGTLLDQVFMDRMKWDAAQWEVYCRAVLLTLGNYVEKAFGMHSYALYRAKETIEHATFDLYKINGVSDITWNDDLLERVRVIVKFIEDAVEILEKKGVPDHLQLRVRREDRHSSSTFYDDIASIIFETICHASNVRSPEDLCWLVQHNMIWGELFNFNRLSGPAAKVVKFKVRRLLYDEVTHMNRFPNFLSAGILAFCLNVMGFTVSEQDYDRDSKALHVAVLSWTKKNYAWLHSDNPRVAEACLVDGITYDPEKLRLIKTYPATGLSREARYVYFDVDPVPHETEKTASGETK